MDMNNTGTSGVGFTDAGVLALLADTTRAGRGYGWGGEGGVWGGPFASPSSNAVRINRNNDILQLGIDRISDQNEENRRNVQNQNMSNQITDGFNRISDRMTTDHTAVRDMIFQQELRNGDRLRDIEREMAANARAMQECCCNIKLQQCEDKAQILAEVRAIETRGVQRDLDRAERENIYLRTISACGCGCGGGVRPCPPVNGNG